LGSDLTGEGGAAAYSGLEVVAGDDEDGGAASVAEGTAATAVLGVGEEDGEVRRVEGVAKVVAACVGDVRTGGARTAGLGAPARCERRRRAVGAAWEEAGRRGWKRGPWPLYRRGEGVGEQRDKLYPESFGRRVRECGGGLIRAGEAGGWGTS